MTNSSTIAVITLSSVLAGCNSTMPIAPPTNNTPTPVRGSAPTPVITPATSTAPAAETRKAYSIHADKDCTASMKDAHKKSTASALIDKARNADGNCYRVDIASAKKQSEIFTYVAKISAPNCGILSSGVTSTAASTGTNALGNVTNILAGGLGRVLGVPAIAGSGAAPARPTSNTPSSVATKPIASATTSVNDTLTAAQRSCAADITVISTDINGIVAQWRKENPKETPNVKVFTNFNAGQYQELEKTIASFAPAPAKR